MKTPIGDTPKQLDQGLLIDGELWTAERIKKLESAYCHLKKSISNVNICGVPLHHLSYDISTHMSVETVDFYKRLEIKAIDDLRKTIKRKAKESQDDTLLDDMLVGWKAAMIEVFSFIDEEIKELERNSDKKNRVYRGREFVSGKEYIKIKFKDEK